MADALTEANENIERDLGAIKVALLAANLQEFNISPLPVTSEVPQVLRPSIYHVLFLLSSQISS